MQIDLTQEDIEVLDKALMDYEKGSAVSGIMGALLGGLCPPDKLEQFEAKERERQAEEEHKARMRRVIASSIRAKLFAAEVNAAISGARLPV